MFSSKSRVSIAIFFCLLAPMLSAAPITFTSSSGDLSASVKFTISGGNLVATLTNTSTNDVLVPSDVLTGVFFNLSGGASLTPITAILGAGSTVQFGGTDPGNSVGGEWAFKQGLSGAPNGLPMGISSTGLGIFGPGDRFPGNNLQGPMEPDGLQYGITSANDNLLTGNAKVTGTQALIQNSVVFTLSGLPSGFDPSTAITEVFFQYGTSLSENPSLVPEPATIVLACISGLGAFLGIRRRRSSLIG